MNGVRIKLAHLDQFFNLRNGDFRSSGHDGIKVPCGLPVNEVAPPVSLPCLHKCEIRCQSTLEYLHASVEFPRFLTLRHDGSVAGRREEAANARTSGANAFRKCSL